MKTLIVNADDFGLTEGVNEGIIRAHRNGLVTSTTLMANGEAFESAVAISRRAPQLGIGVHLNLTQGRPVAPPPQIPTLVGPNGHFHMTPSGLLWGLTTRQVELGEIETELRAQVSKVLAAGIRPTHLDGHKHVHVLPGISEVVIRLAQDYGIQSVRCPIETAPSLKHLLRSSDAGRGAILKQYALARVVARFARQFKDRLIEAGLNCPARFYGLSQTGFLNEASLAAILRRVPEGASELMCHPGYLDADLHQAGTRLLKQREVELRALTCAKVKGIVGSEGIRLIAYRRRAVPRRQDQTGWAA
jgi:chitin disaccharide deacetylase